MSDTDIFVEPPLVAKTKLVIDTVHKSDREAGLFKIAVIEGDTYLDFKGAKKIPGTRGATQLLFQSIIGQQIGMNMVKDWGTNIPLSALADYWGFVVEYLNETEVDPAAYSTISNVITAYLADRRARFQSKLDRGSIEFTDLRDMFVLGDEVCFRIAGELVGGVVSNLRMRRSFMANYMEVSVKIIHNFNGNLEEASVHANIPVFGGLERIEDLPVQKLNDAARKVLAERGVLFRKITAEASYMSYTGQLTRSAWFAENSYRSDGRVMIDSTSFMRVDSEQHRNQGYAIGFDSDRDQDRTAKFVLEDESLWRTYPFVWGFSFASKQWGRMQVSGLRPIAWREDAFDKLVMDPEEKELVRSLVEHQTGTFQDLIEDKGGGTIFLLHGPPGQGKTLTAESVAEVLKRPLYSISVGELGTEPDTLDKRLREILDVATVWNAVLLLDEADIYLESRDEHDIVRNAMVGVFLRLLEYHQGVLFLTTNRVRNIDEAFYSRISVALHFDDADDAKRFQVWRNLLAAAKVKGIDAQALAPYELNGRQIKNIIRLAQTLAKAKDVPVDMPIMRKVIDLTTRFRKEVHAVRPLASGE